jgi:serine/threonine protein phosphatase PrpC/tetratricopeptide (TPR) repeat protein
MRKDNSTIRTKFISEPGSYLHNLDYFAFAELEDFACYCIADGIDNDTQKKSAEIAVSAVLETFHEYKGFSKKLMRRCLKMAQRELLHESTSIRLEASISVVLTDYKKFMWGMAGNTRLYCIRNGKIRYESSDQSLSQKMADHGELELDRIQTHEERHNLYCYLGQPGRFKPYISSKKKLEDGDIITLYTRGVWESIGVPELLDSVEESSKPEDICTGLEEVILSQQMEVMDNYTIVSIFVDKVYKNAHAKKIKRLLFAGGMIVLVLAITIGITQFMKSRENKKKINQMLNYLNNGTEFMMEENYARASEEFDLAQSIAEKVSVSKSSDIYKKKILISQYQKLSVYVVDAEAAFEREQYEKAEKNYAAAINVAKEVEDFDEKNMDYLQNLDIEAGKYLEFQKTMIEGDKYLHISDYKMALESYRTAYDLALEILNSEGKEEAETKIKEIEDKMDQLETEELITQGDSFVGEGDTVYEEKKLKLAIDKYELAKQSYELAQEESKVAAVQIKIDNLKLEQKETTAKELSEEGRKYEIEGDQYYDAQKFDKAIEMYDLALESYKEAEKEDKVTGIDEKIRNAKKAAQGLDEDTTQQEALASDYMVKAMEQEQLGKKETAKAFYELALEIYIKIGDMDKVQVLKEAIKGLEK